MQPERQKEMGGREKHCAHLLLPFLMLLAFGLPAAAANAQDSPAAPAGQEKTAPQKDETAGQAQPANPQDEAAKQEQPAEETTEKPAKPITLNLEPAWQDWNLRGNVHKFRQYATPPNGLFLRELRWWPYASTQGYQGLLALRGLFEDDYRSEARLDLLWGNTRLRGWMSRNRFFAPTPVFVPESERRISDGSIKQYVGRSFAISLHYDINEETHHFDPPLDPLVQKTRYSDVMASGKVGNGQLALTASTWRYTDRTLALRDTRVDRWEARYLWEPTLNLGIEGAYSRYTIDQAGSRSGNVEAITLAGDMAAGRFTDVSLYYRRDKLSLPMVQNAVAREHRLFNGRLSHRWRNGSAMLGIRQREVERVRADQSFVDVPSWFGVEGRVSSRLNRLVRLVLRGYTESLSKDIPMVNVTDPRPLYWKDRHYAQARLEGGNLDLNGYLTYTFQRWENNIRKAELSQNSILVGGNWQASPDVSFFAEFTHDAWSGRSEISTFPTLGNFTPDSQIYVFGVNWALSPRTFLSANYSDFRTSNDNPLLLRDGNTRGHFLTLQARYRFPAGHELGLVVAPWSYNDRLVDLMDYHTTVIMLTGSGKF